MNFSDGFSEKWNGPAYLAPARNDLVTSARHRVMSAETSSTANDGRHVFISHASEDLELADRIVERLERGGIRCWIAHRDIEPAASYPAAITAAMTASAAVLLLLTDAANGSPHVRREIEMAFNFRIPILPK